jgi:uncharacterized protein VirK/YbjX
LRKSTPYQVFSDDSLRIRYHYFGHRHYLSKALTARQRNQIALNHYTFESSQWTDDYQKAVYGGTGLVLWRVDTAHGTFRIQLQAGYRGIPEGDLLVSLWAAGDPVHHMNFTWLIDELDGLTVPFLTRSQAVIRNRYAKSAFERSFPQNLPAYFCYSAIQGMARVVGSPRAYGVRAHEQIGGAETCSSGSYDDFWRALGGRDEGGLGVLIVLPAHRKNLDQVPRAHRKRAQARRRNWAEIEAAAIATMTAAQRP